MNVTTKHRSGMAGILSMKPAPIVVLWGGFPGTSGNPSVDYVVSDRFMCVCGDQIVDISHQCFLFFVDGRFLQSLRYSQLSVRDRDETEIRLYLISFSIGKKSTTMTENLIYLPGSWLFTDHIKHYAGDLFDPKYRTRESKLQVHRGVVVCLVVVVVVVFVVVVVNDDDVVVGIVVVVVVSIVVVVVIVSF